ncbi:MAG TPA: electron transport complex subunit RsxC [Dissulfurispiraceae bacterium]|nr:electron transport complex subunit RsxC [Dissulfurispiraceae bacterium]
MGLATFRGGVHPPDKKELAKQSAITPTRPPKRVIIPLSQHIGAPCKLAVGIGQEVRKGEVIGTPEGFVSAPVHSSVAGKVTGIVDCPTAIGRMVPAVVIENNGSEEWAPLKDNPDYLSLKPEDLRAKVKDAGIVGMGGAAFPTHVKLSPPKEKPVDVVILNGAECEPYLTADYRLMIERPQDVVEGLKVIMRIVGVTKGFIGIEENKPDAVEIMSKAVAGEPNLKVITCAVKYPQGAEKMLIKACVDRVVPARALPMDCGVVVQNIGTAVAIFEAARYGKPLIERVVTVTGEGVREPKNLLVKVGTMIADLVEECGGLKEDTAKVISGGPMMGFAISTLETPVTKGTSGVLALPESEVRHADTFGPCIRCGRCIEACPMGLMPSMISITAEKGFYEETKAYNLYDCFECGTCTYVCPSKRPIVHLVRLAKSQVKP